ncbi:uncharacterized protein LOC113232918 [Hyposmocoma kahamanoa]|uniref:uncharacterized protein LOC113232918 n=1 Tax=Hyposmocoma kahamanoa TaxID=1477025 RepID=UPI000E6D7FCB|nr:uncharacterized protein LOC113232918 [Hyposmocoma kahamanoa]
MLTGFIVFSLLVFQTFPSGLCSSLLCGRTKEVEVGEGVGAGAALALALVRSSPAMPTEGPCQLRLNAPDAAAFTVRLIDVKESLVDWERGQIGVQAPAPVAGAPGRKWSARNGASAQDTAPDQSALVTNATDSCKRSKPSDTPVNIPASCIDLSPTVTVTATSRELFSSSLPPSPPEYEPPPSYSSLFPRAFKSSPTPVPHCSHQEPPD